MKSYDFYKSLYDRELKRRIDLDNSLSTPIGLIAILIGLISYVIANIDLEVCNILILIIFSFTIISMILIICSIFFIARSYNNFFKGYGYRNFALTTKLREFEMKVNEYNDNNIVKQKIDFEATIIDRLTQLTDDHIIFNDFRQRNLYYAKSLIIGTAFSTMMAVILEVVYKYLLI